MANQHNALPPIPAKRYFTLDELCCLADISTAQFALWQQTHGSMIGYGGNRYTRLDVIKVRQLRDGFAPYVNGFTRNQMDAEGNPAIDARAAREQLQKLLRSLESALAK